MAFTGTTHPLDQAKEAFAEQNLPFPPLPQALAERLQAFGNSVFTTRELDYGPYGLEAFSGSLLAGEPTDDYAVLGFDGHGINSWAVHYYLVQGPIALFIQIEWGGAYTDADEARQRVQTAFEWAGALQPALDAAASQGKIPAGTRLAAVYSDFAPSGWTWWKPGESEYDWHSEGDVITEAGNAVVNLFES